MADMSQVLQHMSDEQVKQYSVVKLASHMQAKLAHDLQASGDRAKRGRPSRADRMQKKLQAANAELIEKDTKYGELNHEKTALEGQVTNPPLRCCHPLQLMLCTSCHNWCSVLSAYGLYRTLVHSCTHMHAAVDCVNDVTHEAC